MTRVDITGSLARLRSFRVACSVIVLIAMMGAPAAAQTAPLAGRVIDDGGLPLPGVSVQATSQDTRTTRGAVTDQDGRFSIAGLTGGRYDVTFSAMNFAAATRRGVEVASGATSPLEITLHISVTASVVVTGASTFRNLADIDHPEENLVGVAETASEGAVTAKQIEARPIMRSGEVLEAVPGVIISQHSGEGKANQYYLRGFNLDHGTDFATTVAGLPVNLPTHAHGQGYSDLNFLIPELVTGVQFRKGPYSADTGDFSAAGSANINYANVLDKPLLNVSTGEESWSRALLAASPAVGRGHLLAALELNHNDGPWTRPDDYHRINGVVRYSQGTIQNGFSLTGMGYSAAWNSTDQVPDRAIASGLIDRFGNIDPTDGGRTARYSAVAEYQHTSGSALTRATAFASRYRLNLFSDFTYFLDDPVHGDQFEQADRRWTTGVKLSQKRKTNLGAHLGETTFGFETRNDAIPLVGLYHTEATRRLDTIREDAVTQTSAAVFVENATHWTPWLRTTAGLRLDAYRFDVASDQPENSGLVHKALASPKLNVVLGPWSQTEFYASAGTGFHSNDARGATITRDPTTGEPADPVTPVVRATGAEVGLRSVAIPHVQTTLSLWRLDLASELVFAGDAGTTEASRPSRRYGVEWTNYARLSRNLTADADIAWSNARFTDVDPVGSQIPGSVQTVASVGVTADSVDRMFGSLRLRYFGPRPLIEDGSVRSEATSLLNGQLGYHVRPNLHVIFDAFNLLNASASDIDYFYTSRLPGEPPAGVDDVHTHPTSPRTVRVVLRVQF